MDWLLPPPSNLEIGPREWIGAGIFAVVGLIACRAIPAMWRGDLTDAMKRMVAVFGEPWTTALVSMCAVGSLGAALTGVAMLAIYTREAMSGFVHVVATLVGSLTFLPGVLCMVLTLSVVFFGRPKLVMPPGLRDSHGIIGSPLLAAWSWLRARTPPRR